MKFGERFLQNPDLFPSRLSGEPWGDRWIRVGIAGVPFALSGLSEAQLTSCSERYDRLLLAPPITDEDILVSLFRAPTSDFLEFDTAGWETTFDFERRPDSLAWAGRGTMARFDRKSHRHAALWTPVGDGTEFPGILENVLRVLVAQRLTRNGGALLHSAGVLRDGAAYLFVGRSGAGKSTLCRLSSEAGHRILSDELNALSLASDSLLAHQLPFAGDFGGVEIERAPFPVAGIFLLRQGERAALQPVSAARALSSLVAASPFVNDDPELDGQALDNLQEVVRRVDVRELTFRLDPDFWSILEGGK
ncbi:MAG: hypothetical protein AB7G12_14240 [Thermoanaerobaculia bacterium]